MILLLLCVAVILLWVVLRSALTVYRRERGSAWCFVVMGGYFYAASFLLTPILWCLAIFPPLNDAHQPFVLGVGGAPYGIEWRYYPLALGYWLGWATVVFIVFKIAERVGTPVAGPPQPWRIDLRGIALYLRLSYVAIVVVTLLLFALFFTLNGWGRLWASSLGRFEVDAARGMSFDPKLHLLLFSILGLICAVGVGLRPVRWIALVGLAACIVTFLIVASRFSTVLVFVALVAIVGSLPKSSRWIALAGMLPLAWLAYLLPLNLRHQPGTGLKFAWISFSEIVRFEYRSPAESLAQIFQNIANGFAIFAHSLDLAANRVNPMIGVPWQYKLLGYSPLPSVVDGYAQNYHQYRPMLNPVTPYNLVSEAYFIHPVLPFASVLFFCLVILFWGKMTVKFSRNNPFVGYTFFAVVALFSLYSQQYLTRGSTKLLAFGCFVTLFVAIVMKLLPARLFRPERPAPPALRRRYEAR